MGSRGAGIAASAGLGLWAACRIAGGTGLVSASTLNIDPTLTVRTGAGTYTVKLLEGAGDGDIEPIITPLINRAAGTTTSAIRVDANTWTVQTQTGGAAADTDCAITFVRVNPV